MQPELQGLPLLAELKDVLYQRPAAKLPVFRKALAGLSADLEDLCEQDVGSHLTLAAAVTAAMCATLMPGSEPMTARLTDKFLIDLLVVGLDQLLPAQQRLGLRVNRDEGDSDSTMTRRWDRGKSLRPDGQLRSGDGQRLLFKWEEKAAGVPLEEAVGDLKGKTTGVEHNCAFTWAACPSSIVQLRCDCSNKQVLSCSNCQGRALPTNCNMVSAHL